MRLNDRQKSRSKKVTSYKAHLYESRFNFFQHPIPEVQALRQFCNEALSHAVVKLIRQANRGSAPVPAIGIDIFESWVHITHTGGYHEVHNHPNCSWCGIYYLEPADCTVDPPNGINRFFSPIDIMYDDPGRRGVPAETGLDYANRRKAADVPHRKHLAVPTRDRATGSSFRLT